MSEKQIGKTQPVQGNILSRVRPILARYRGNGYEAQDIGVPRRLTLHDLEKLKNELPPELRGDVDTYWSDWVEQNEEDIDKFMTALPSMIRQGFQETHGALQALKAEVSVIHKAVSSQYRKKECYSVRETAEMFGCSEDTIRRKIKEGKLTATRDKQKDPWKITQADIDEYFATYGNGEKVLVGPKTGQ